MWKPLSVVSLCAVAALAGWNYFGVYHPVSSALKEDVRNEKVSIAVYRQYGVSPSTIVFDVREVKPEAALADVTRTLFKGAEALKERRFERVVLAHEGHAKFYLEGEYFQELGKRFSYDNPVYLLRTLPENVHKLDGTKAYGTWTGGILGVLGRQLEDLNAFGAAWLVDTEAIEKARAIANER